MVPPTQAEQRSMHFSSRGNAKISCIVLHHTAGTDSLKWLINNPKGVSTHVLIPKDGRIIRMVPDVLAAHTVGFSNIGRYTTASGDAGNANQISLNIELENLGNGKDPYTDAQYHACAWQVAAWWQRHGALPVLTHALIDAYGKNDPRGFDLLDLLWRALLWRKAL
jgi:N-acetylmuramoyl-L-alanine amidase